MRPLTYLRSRDSWFLDSYKITNFKKIVDISEARIAKSVKLPPFDEKKNFFVIDSKSEMIETLHFSFAAFIRFYDSFNQDLRYVWINKDAGTKSFNVWNKTKCFLGRWEFDNYKKLKIEINQLGGRIYIVQKDWFIQIQQQLIKQKFMPGSKNITHKTPF
jgi:hypothetical protein